MKRAFVIGSLLFCGACGEAANLAPITDDPVATQRQAIRPTSGSGSGTYGGVMAQVYDPPGNHFRVYYVTTGENAVDATDEAPKDGVPDFAQQVGAAAEKTYQSTVIERGFRPPLDDSIYHDTSGDFGGDGRFDIYLLWAGAGSDGYRVTEVCTDGSDGGSRGRCAGYFVMNPSFAGSSYPSTQDGIEVLTSHELFHAIQDAYASGQWRTISEGTAVWNELQVYPAEDGTWQDYLGFLPALFNAPERPIDKSMGSGGAAAFAYGTAAWFEYLAERFGPSIIREIWEGLEAPPTGSTPPFLDVTDAQLRSNHQASLGAAFTEFTRWNLLTANRASADRGYKRAAEYPAVRFEADVTAIGQSANLQIDGLSARYLAFRPTLAQATAVRVTVRDPIADPPTAALFVQHANGNLDPQIDLAMPQDVTLNSGEALLVVVTGAVKDGSDRMVSVQFETPSASQVQEDGGCVMSQSRSPRDRAAPFGLLLCAIALVLRRRNQAVLRASSPGEDHSTGAWASERSICMKPFSPG